MDIRNVVLVTVDCLRADHLPIYGYDRETAPFLAELSGKATVFDAAFSTGPGTSVSFPSIMSSTFPFDYGGYDGLGEHRTPVASVLSGAGISTAGIHSNAYLTPHYGYDRGFDRYESFLDESRLDRIVERGRTLLGVLASRSPAELLAAPRTLLRPPAPYAQAEEVTDLAIDWIDDLASGPFFAWVHYMDVHGPYHPPDRYRERFQDDPTHVQRTNEVWRRGLDTPDALSADEVGTLIDAYDTEIRYVDEQLQRLFAALDSKGLLGETLVIVTADHGEEFREHGRISHSPAVYDELVHVPLLVFHPDGTLPDRVPGLVSLLDVAPTVLSAFDLPAPDDYRGSPLQRFADESGAGGYDAVVAEVSHRGAAADQRYQRSEAIVGYRTSDRKYVRDNQTGAESFFDVAADPGEIAPDPDAISDSERDDLRAAVDEHLDALYRGDRETTGAVPDAVEQRLDDLGYVD